MRQREKETTKRKNRRAMMALSEKERERDGGRCPRRSLRHALAIADPKMFIYE